MASPNPPEPWLRGTHTDLDAVTRAVLHAFELAEDAAAIRVRAFTPDQFNNPRTVGRAMLPATIGGLLVHCADHTQRHIGQAVTTAKIIVAMRG
ncbi:MAG TPA: hypothetical protein VN612_08990 [Acidobacteriaceae bacterium]|nr:hypothetical protein [Acidobacteriaceae bacterium]